MIKTAIVGLGRLGKSHAQNLNNIPACELTAVCSIVPEELQWAKQNLPNAQGYTSYDELLEKADCEAVFLVTSTSMHGEQIIKGFRAGKHVFCEKPLAKNLDECLHTAQIIKNEIQDKIFMLGFVRRFDKAYAYAKQKINEGYIGEPFLIRSQTTDHNDFAPFQVKFTQTSGGIFHDMNIHDIDLARWFLGSEIKSAYAIGGSFVHKEFETINDADNTIATCQCEDGKIAIISASRTAFHGHDTRAEIHGTKGILRIGYKPSQTDVTILDDKGIREECLYTFFDRFEEAFFLETKEFFNCIKNNRPSPISIEDAVRATQVAEAITKSFKEHRVINISY